MEEAIEADRYPLVEQGCDCRARRRLGEEGRSRCAEDPELGDRSIDGTSSSLLKNPLATVWTW
jgi:hypothetical protein